MNREVIKLTQGAQPHHVAPPVSSLEASPWEYEDPGDVVEGEEQGVASGGGCGDGEGAVEGGLSREMGRAEGVPREEAGEGGQCRGAVRAEGALQKFGERAEEAGLSMEASLLDNEGQGELVEVGDLGAASGGGVHGGGGSGLGGAGAVGGGWAVVKGVGGIGAKVRGTLKRCGSNKGRSYLA